MRAIATTDSPPLTSRMRFTTGTGSGQRPLRVCAVQRRRFPVGASPTRQSLQPEAIGAVMEVTKWLKPSISVSRIGDSASVLAKVARRIDDADVMHLLKVMLKASGKKGVPQGGVISPLLSHLYLNRSE